MPNSIALIAHESKKNDIVTLVQRYHSLLNRYLIVATPDTGKWIQDATNLTVETVVSEADGGLLQIAARLVSSEVVGVIFLMDTINVPSQLPDVQALLRVCNRYEVPLATNIATAELAIQGVAKRRDAYLIFNPIAGQGNPDRDLALIQKILEPQMNLHIILTQPDIDPVEQAKEAITAIQSAQSEDSTACIIASGEMELCQPLQVPLLKLVFLLALFPEEPPTPLSWL